MAELLLGIDVGTSSSKAVLVRPDGAVLRSHAVEHEISIPHPGWAEQDADEVWWADVVKLCRALLDGKPYSGRDVAGVGVSAIGPCMLPLDGAGRPLRPGILYGIDTRAGVEILELQRDIGDDELFDASGMVLSSQAVGPKILWFRRNEPDLWGLTARITTASSYLTYRLTGEHVIDRHTASHFLPLTDLRTLEWSERWADRVLDGRALPRQAWSDESAGSVTAKGAAETGLAEGTPVAVGAVDALSEAISVGVTEPGDLMITYGSTAFFILVLDRPRPDRRLWSLAGAFAGQYNLAAGMATTGVLTRWFRDQLASGADYEDLFTEAAAVAPGAGGLLMLPYFSGERTPLNDPAARGVIAGLSLSTTRSQMFRAVLEAVAFGVRHNLETFGRLQAPINRVVAVGGGAQTAIWPQVVSDVAGISQVLPKTGIGASYGDAFLAGLAAGLLTRGDLAAWIKPGITIEPNPRLRELYDLRYRDYLDLYERTRDIVHRLSETV
jgi:xylulokinase